MAVFAAVLGLSFWRGGMAGRWGYLAGDVAATRCRKLVNCQHPHRRSVLAVSADQQKAGERGIEGLKTESKPKKAKARVNYQLFDYVQAHTREPEILRELRLETKQMPGSQMQVSPDQAQFLAMLVQLMGAEQCIEVGVFNGYSSLAVALVLPDSGRLVACDRSEKSLAVAQRYYERAGVAHKVDVRLGLAIDTLNELLLGGAGRYDFAFIDADKRLYFQYYELLLKLVRAGGLVVVDNVLWHGTVADPLIVDTKTQSIREFNDFLVNDVRISYNMVAIGDGMALCRKL